MDFFNLNALASPVVVKVDFDIAMTLIANTFRTPDVMENILTPYYNHLKGVIPADAGIS